MKLSRRNFLSGSAVALASVAAVSGRGQAATIPEAPTTASPAMQPPIAAAFGPGLPAGRDAERLDPALAHERRVEGIPPRRRAGDARVCARHEGQPLGL